ncbi:unnamed protein product, partial [Rotaria magnacalcarata]
ASEKLPPTLLSDLSAQISYPPGQDDLHHQQAIFTSYELGAFYNYDSTTQSEFDLNGPSGRFSPPPVTEAPAQGGAYAVVETTMQDVADILTCDAYVHWGYLSQELQKW